MVSIIRIYEGADRKSPDGLWLRCWSEKKEGARREHRTRAGMLWESVLRRCSPLGLEQNKHPTYLGCINKFSSFQEFAEWCNAQYGYMNTEENGTFWKLDKDILIPGSKCYSSETCCFVPHYINCLLLTSDATRGIYPLGVKKTIASKPFVATARERKPIHLGYFQTPEEAHAAWQEAKANIIRKAADGMPAESEKVCAALHRIADFIDQQREHGEVTTSLSVPLK